MVSAAELAQIQADASAAACSLSCAIQRKTIIRDAYGTATETYATISAPSLLVGMSQPSANQLANYDFMIGSLASWQVRLPVGTDVQHQDHLIVANQTLVVQVVLAPRSYPGLLTVLASEIK